MTVQEQDSFQCSFLHTIASYEPLLQYLPCGSNKGCLKNYISLEATNWNILQALQMTHEKKPATTLIAVNYIVILR